jgi:hypothetical protein
MRWDQRTPLGKITLLDGDPGLGKSLVSIDLAARLTRGRRMPDGSASLEGDVVMMSAEDGLGDTIRPRLAQFGCAGQPNTYARRLSPANFCSSRRTRLAVTITPPCFKAGLPAMTDTND